MRKTSNEREWERLIMRDSEKEAKKKKRDTLIKKIPSYTQKVWDAVQF